MSSSQRPLNLQSELKYEFYAIPKLLFVSKKFKDMSLDAKVMYGIFLSRVKLSKIKKYYDKNGDLYFFYSIESLVELLGYSKPKIIKIRKELIGFGLLKEEKTGRGNRFYLYSAEDESVSTEEIIEFENVIEDETKISEEESKNRSIDKKKYWEKQRGLRQKEQRYSFINRVHEVKNRYFVYSSPSNQHSWKIEKYTKSKFFTSEVKSFDPRYIELDRVDKNIDYILDQQTETEQKNSSKHLMFKEQYLADMSREYSPEIMMAVKFASEYEDLTMLNRVLKNAMDDIFKGKPYAYKEASEHIQSISTIIGQLGYYHSAEISIAVKNAIVRATRFAHSGEKSIENSASYYYAAIQKAIINYVVDNYELNPKDTTSVLEVDRTEQKRV